MSEHKLLELLKGVNKNTIWGAAIHHCLDSNGNLGELVLELQSQYLDSPNGGRTVLGNELSKYIMSPFAPLLQKMGDIAISKIQGRAGASLTRARQSKPPTSLPYPDDLQNVDFGQDKGSDTKY